MNMKLKTVKKPFSEWLNGLKDKRTKARLLARLTKVELGNFGDTKLLKGANGIWELREDFGPGYRSYYSRRGGKIILLLAGADKSDQDRTIDKAKEYLADYERRMPQ
jgi:putative addiction module killer protein